MSLLWLCNFNLQVENVSIESHLCEIFCNFFIIIHEQLDVFPLLPSCCQTSSSYNAFLFMGINPTLHNHFHIFYLVKVLSNSHSLIESSRYLLTITERSLLSIFMLQTLPFTSNQLVPPPPPIQQDHQHHNPPSPSQQLAL